jgi:hypothetical protein
MKKINSILKTIVAVIIVLVMAQGCVPNPVGGNPPATTGDFNVNLLLGDAYVLESVVNDTIINIDNDSIAFRGFTRLVIGGNKLKWEIYFKNTSNNTYQFLMKNGDVAVLQPNINIPADLDTSYSWLAPYAIMDANPIEPAFERQDFDKYIEKTNTYSDPMLLGGLGGRWLNGDPYGYIVCRKIVGSQLQYYWIKVGATSFRSFYYSYSSAFYNGKFQMNSIITGQ